MDRQAPKKSFCLRSGEFSVTPREGAGAGTAACWWPCCEGPFCSWAVVRIWSQYPWGASEGTEIRFVLSPQPRFHPSGRLPVLWSVVSLSDQNKNKVRFIAFGLIQCRYSVLSVWIPQPEVRIIESSYPMLFLIFQLLDFFFFWCNSHSWPLWCCRKYFA